MFRREFLKISASATLLTAAAPAETKDTSAMSNANFADVNDQHVFYSVHGSGKPLIVLHGGINPDSYGTNLAAFAEHRKVIAVHLQGHGRTPDTSRPLSSEALSDDIAALIRYLKLSNADVMGYSLGSGVALQTAVRHSGLVDRLILISGMMRRNGAYPEVEAAFDKLESNATAFGPGLKASPIGQAYPDVDWTNLFRKVGSMARRQYDFETDVAKIRARTMLVFADADMVRTEHIVEFWKALGGGNRDAGLDGSLRPANQLAIVPNTTHYTIPVDPLLPQLVERFLSGA